jgi:hypothetical protein
MSFASCALGTLTDGGLVTADFTDPTDTSYNLEGAIDNDFQQNTSSSSTGPKCGKTSANSPF